MTIQAYLASVGEMQKYCLYWLEVFSTDIVLLPCLFIGAAVWFLIQ
jgi:hypothetical protein